MPNDFRSNDVSPREKKNYKNHSMIEIEILLLTYLNFFLACFCRGLLGFFFQPLKPKLSNDFYTCIQSKTKQNKTNNTESLMQKHTRKHTVGNLFDVLEKKCCFKIIYKKKRKEES